VIRILQVIGWWLVDGIYEGYKLDEAILLRLFRDSVSGRQYITGD